MSSIYSFEDLNYHHAFNLIKCGLSDYSTAEKFVSEIEKLKLTSPHFVELVVCKTLETHDNKESDIHFDKKEMNELYNDLVKKYFG